MQFLIVFVKGQIEDRKMPKINLENHLNTQHLIPKNNSDLKDRLLPDI